MPETKGLQQYERIQHITFQKKKTRENQNSNIIQTMNHDTVSETCISLSEVKWGNDVLVFCNLNLNSFHYAYFRCKCFRNWWESMYISQFSEICRVMNCQNFQVMNEFGWMKPICSTLYQYIQLRSLMKLVSILKWLNWDLCSTNHAKQKKLYST